MNELPLAVIKQIEWAKNRGLQLVEGDGNQARQGYLTCADANLFRPLNPETEAELLAGKGQEFKGRGGMPPRSQALHSSSVLAVNLFDYWRKKTDLSPMLSACELYRGAGPIAGEIRFAQKFPVLRELGKSPVIDVMIYPGFKKGLQAVAVDCKFLDPYSRRRSRGLDPKYLADTSIWKNLPATYALAQEILSNDNKFYFLNAAQLIKQVLSLSVRYPKKKMFGLLYIWSDVLSELAFVHGMEAEELRQTLHSDGIEFVPIRYQDIVASLAAHRAQHPEYIAYLTDRYL